MQPAARIASTIELLADLFGAWLGGRKQPADLAMNSYFRARRFIGSHDRGTIAELSYFILRNLGTLEWWCKETMASYPSILQPEPALQDAYSSARALTIVALVLRKDVALPPLQALFNGNEYAPSVLTEKEMACMRALENQALYSQSMPLHARLNFPAWMEVELRDSLGDNLEDEMQAMMAQASVDLRVNTLKTTRDALIEALKREGFDPTATPLSPVGIRLNKRENLFATKLFQSGHFEMQDEGSQLAALLVDARPGQRVIDFCAGAGGKTLALAASMNNKGRILAWDTSASRLKDLPIRLKRAGVDNVEWKPITSESDSMIKRHKGTADRVLVDAPCTGTGTWRRSPDLKWRTSPKDLAELQDIQRRVLDSAARLVKPGGKLVYATCSLLKSENQQQIERFLRERNDFRVVCAKKIWDKTAPDEANAKPFFLSLSPHQDGTDGFFAAALERTA